MGSRPADLDRGGARGLVWLAAGCSDRMGFDALSFPRPPVAERTGASAVGVAARRHRLAVVDSVWNSWTDRVAAVVLVRYPPGVHHRRREPRLCRDDLPGDGAFRPP